MKTKTKCIYLISSNASEKYAIDVLETFSLPFGLIHHYRYQLKWLYPELRRCLSEKKDVETREITSKKLEDSTVILCYLHQVRDGDNWTWKNIYPYRSGRLVEAYKTGDDDTDIAHFYFKVAKYVDLTKTNGQLDLLNQEPKLKDKTKRCYGFIGSFDMIEYLVDREKSQSAFHKIAESEMFQSFKSPEGFPYYPVFCFIEGIRKDNSKFIDPKYDSLTKKSYFELTECERYMFDFSTYFLIEPPLFSFSLNSDKNLFSSPAKYSLKISSRYDEESWLLISSFLDKDIWTNINFSSDLSIENKTESPLNLNLNFPVKIKRKLTYRTIDITADTFFAFATIVLAVSKAVEIWWWYIPFIIGYTIWGICKFIIRFWKG